MTENNGNGNTLKYRVEQAEINVLKTEEKLEEILTNHLPHIQVSIVELKTRINIMTAINVGAILLGLMISKMFF